MQTKPVIDYRNLPYLSREGIQGGASGKGKFLTKSLFLETCVEEKYPNVRWCLAEHEVYCPSIDKWIPSAWMAFIYATDEYDALRKICGNVRQWEAIKKMHFNTRPMADVLNDWRMEQAYIQRAAIKDVLLQGALGGGPGYTAAAKMLLQLIDAPAKKGRPMKGKEDAAPSKEAAASADHERLAQLFPRSA